MASVGDSIGTYEIVAVIARGGMGMVYRARDNRLGRDVALKLLAPELSGDANFRARFERESKIAGGLRHPNIVPVFDAGEWEGQLYLAMMLVDGPSLATVIARDRHLAPERVAAIVGQLAGALDAAHAQQIVHRDIKPGNVLVLEGAGPRGTDHVYLADFGLTRSANSSGPMTRTGTFMGTLNYIAPEQLQGAVIDGRADQYALACTTFEMLASSPPFVRDSEAAVMWAHINAQPPALAVLRPDLPAGLTPVHQRAMAKSPDERFPTTAAFAGAFAAAVAGARVVSLAPNGMSATPTVEHQAVYTKPYLTSRGEDGHANRRWTPVIAGLIAVALVSMLAYTAFAVLNSPTATERPHATLPEVAVLTPSANLTPASPNIAAPSIDDLPATTPFVVPPTDGVQPTAVPHPGFNWVVTLTSSNFAPFLGERITITAATNGNVSDYGASIEILNPASEKVHNTCWFGRSCTADANPDLSGPKSYVARVVGADQTVLAWSEQITVTWTQLPGTPNPPTVPPVTLPPQLPTAAPATPQSFGPGLRDGFYSVVHTFDYVSYGDPEYQPAQELRTYELLSYSCTSDVSCRARFNSTSTDTRSSSVVPYWWDGYAFEYGPRNYSDGLSCSGESNAYTASQYVYVEPVEWQGDNIDVLRGYMTVTGTPTFDGEFLGCQPYEVVFTTEIAYVGD